MERAGRALLFAGRPDIYGPHPSNPRSSGPCGITPCWATGSMPPRTCGPWPHAQMLHAWRLELPHPVDGALLRFSCPPPEDLLETALAATRRMRRMVITGSPGSGKSALTENIAATGAACHQRRRSCGPTVRSRRGRRPVAGPYDPGRRHSSQPKAGWTRPPCWRPCATIPVCVERWNIWCTAWCARLWRNFGMPPRLRPCPGRGRSAAVF